MLPLRRLVVDVLKPHEPPLVQFTEEVSDAAAVDGVTATVIELDTDVQNVELSFEGEALEFAAIEEAIEELGGTIHSVDQVACGEYVVEDRTTLQDR